jgi:phosphate transport system protein
VELYGQVLRELLGLILANPRTLHRPAYLLRVGHGLERMGDRVVNICKRAVFTVAGQMVEMGINGGNGFDFAEAA